MATDFLGVEIKEGDTIVYPVRFGSSLYMKKATVTAVITESKDRWNYQTKQNESYDVVSLRIEGQGESYEKNPVTGEYELVPRTYKSKITELHRTVVVKESNA